MSALFTEEDKYIETLRGIMLSQPKVDAPIVGILLLAGALFQIKSQLDVVENNLDVLYQRLGMDGVP